MSIGTICAVPQAATVRHTLAFQRGDILVLLATEIISTCRVDSFHKLYGTAPSSQIQADTPIDTKGTERSIYRQRRYHEFPCHKRRKIAVDSYPSDLSAKG